jgi:hypothetical protein
MSALGSLIGVSLSETSGVLDRVENLFDQLAPDGGQRQLTPPPLEGAVPVLGPSRSPSETCYQLPICVDRRFTNSLKLVLGTLTKVLGSPLEIGSSLLGLLGSSLLISGRVLDGIPDLLIRTGIEH